MSVPKITVVAAGAYEHSLKLISDMFENDERCLVQIDFGNARAVTSKVTSRNDVDVVLTSFQGMEEIQAADRIRPDTRVSVGTMRIGAAVPNGMKKPNVGTTDALRAALLSASSIAHIDPNGGGTTGPYFTKLMDILGITAEVKNRIRLCASGRDVVRTLLAGDAEIGLTQASELIGIPSLEFAGFLPSELQLLTIYQAAMASSSPSKEEARRFLTYLTGTRAAEQFLKSGWSLGE